MSAAPIPQGGIECFVPTSSHGGMSPIIGSGGYVRYTDHAAALAASEARADALDRLRLEAMAGANENFCLLRAAEQSLAEALKALQRIAEFDGADNTPVRNSVKKTAIARAAIDALLPKGEG